MKRIALLVLFAAALSVPATPSRSSDDPPPQPKKQPQRAKSSKPAKADKADSRRTEDEPDHSKIELPEGDQKAANEVLKRWLTVRGIECKLLSSGVLDFKRNGILLNIYPYIFKDSLNRLRIVAIFTAKKEHKKSEALEKFAARMNKAQNFLTVFVSESGDLAVSGNLTFINRELTAKEFDYFGDLMTLVIQRYILPDSDVKKLLE